jgi:Spy/CpxP family protein refolding chaperone
MLLSRKSITVAIAVFLFAALTAIVNPHLQPKTLSSTAWEQPIAQMSRQVGVKEGSRGRFLDRLNLTNNQKQQIASIRQKYRRQIEQLQEDAQAAQEELFNMMAGTESENVIRTKRQEVVQLRQELGDLRFESMMEMRDVLTPEQRTQLAQMIQQRRDNWRNRFGDSDRSHQNNWF